MARKATLSNDMKLFIVEHLARFDSPSTVAAAVEKEFGRKVPRQTIEGHDPTKVTRKNLAAKWREHFHLVRKSFREDIEAIPIASRAVRLLALDRMARRFEDMGNMIGAMAAIEQAAKEMGGSYVGRGAITAKPEETSAPKSPGADVCAELGKRFTVVKGGKS